ncbi:MAG TPA: hypothetical protein VHR18_12565 [Solirubrobacterales bacterium]|nr:hypothetical protein [Solirubrobacterales bacterium]
MSQNIYVAEAGANEKQTFNRPTTVQCEPATQYVLTYVPTNTTSVKTAACNVNTLAPIQEMITEILGAGNGTLTGSVALKTLTFGGSLANTNIPAEAIEIRKATGTGCPADPSCLIAKSATTQNGAAARISFYEPSGTPVSNTIGTGVAGASYYGVDVYGANGRVYAADVAHNKALIFNPAGSATVCETNGSEAPSGAFTAMDKAAVAVDQSNGNMLVSDVKGHGVVDEFNAGCKYVTEITHTPAFTEGNPADIAVDNSGTASKGTVYVSAGVGTGSVYGYEALSPKFTLSVAKTGNGTVRSSLAGVEDAGIVCGVDCSQEYAEGEVVALTATPDSGWQLKEWTGACTGSGACSVTMSSAKAVSAVFEVIPGQPLTITKPGTGTGVVECEVASVKGACAATYPNGTEVKVFATPNAGSEFTGFGGDCTGSFCVLTMSAPKSVTATFDLIPRTLTITKAGTGTGVVECEVASVKGPCAASYPNGTVVKVIGTANSGSEFAGFSGGTGSASICTTTSPCTFTIEADSTLTATFNLIPRTLTITKAGTGTGTVECEVASVLGPCAASYPNGTVVKVIGTANSGSEFAGFSGGTGSASICTTTSPCTFTIEANSTLTATFSIEGEKTLTITKAGTGTGVVECEVASVKGPCAASYPNGTVVKVIATANSGSEFAGFSGGTGSAGACTTTSPCTFTIEANSTLTATFNLIPRSLSVTNDGTGSGTIECEVASIKGACASNYPNGTVVKAIAIANAGSEFAGFSGTGSASACTTSPCTFTIEAGSTLTATFNLIPRTLTITKAGTGTGVVECEVASVKGACAASYPNGTVVKVIGTANAGSEFAGFSSGTGSAGACTGTAPCTFTITANSTLTATFNLIPRTLTVTKAGAGGGTIECEVASVLGPCAASYPNGTSVKVIATPNAGSQFAGFSGGTGSASSCTTSPCTFTIEANSTLTATFTLIGRALTITKAGTGGGTIECEVASIKGACAASYPNGTSVKVIATPNAGSQFAGFSGGTGSASACATSPCTFTIEADSTLTATINLIQRPLTVTKAGTGTGTVTCNGVACASSYADGAVVTLAATPAAGSTFTGWSGSGCSGTGTCVVTMDAAKAVTATFAQITRTLSVTIGGSGSVTCNGGPCAASYPEGAVITLVATPAAGSTFTGWEGSGCSGTGNCVITLKADAVVLASFAPEAAKEGTPKVATPVVVSGGKAPLKISCKGSGPCSGTVKLTAKIKQGKKMKNVVIGKASYNVEAGKSKTIKVKLNGAAKKLLNEGKSITAKLSGPGMKGSVKLKPPKK